MGMGPVEEDLDGLLSRMAGGPVLPTQRKYAVGHRRRSWYTGPVGCAKTSSLVIRTILPALMYPGSEWLVARWRYWTLEQTTLKRFLEVCRRLGPNIFAREPKVGPPFEIWLNTGAEPSHIIFHGLDDFEKLLSTEFLGISVDEANEIDFTMASTLDDRLRQRLPSQVREGKPAEGPFFLNLASNPVVRSHWLHKKFCAEEDSDPVPWGQKFKPIKDENVLNLPPRYYETIAEGKSPEMILRMIEGECGPDPMGEGVFSQEFVPKLHIGRLKPNPNMKMGRSWDFGRRRPCVTWFQRVGNQINRHLCELGNNESLDKFADRILMMSRGHFPMIKEWEDVCDPHGNAKEDVSDLSRIDILIKKGLRPRYLDHSIKTGLEQMSKGLNTMVNGRPMSMFDEVGCKGLIDGYMSGYVWPMPRPGHPVKEKPVADGFYEHFMDTDRYIMVDAFLGSKMRTGSERTKGKVLRKVRNPYTGY